MVRDPARKREFRLILLLFLFSAFLLLIAVRLLFIQVVHAKKYRNMAIKTHVQRVELPAARGAMYDREGDELAVSVEMRTIYATPYLVKDRKQVARRIARVLGTKAGDVEKKLSQENGFVYLARKIDQKKAAAVERLKIEGIGIAKESKRFYPLGALASQTLGFAGLDNEGLSGLELYYDPVLRGKPGYLMKEIDPFGRPIPGGVFKFSPSRKGKSVVLTLDRDIQYRTQQALDTAVEKFGAANGIAAVMNPKTGGIYALANTPAFNLNRFDQAAEEDFRNRAVTDAFEPGSTMKVVTAAAALEEKMVNPKTLFYLRPTIRVADRVIKESHSRGGKTFSVSEIVSHSSNVGAVTLGLKLGKEKLYKYIDTFGLTKATNLDFPGEINGYTPRPENWSGSSIGNIPFGQGISVTPMQMLVAISTIANDGMYVQPHLVSRIIDNDGTGTMPRRITERKVISSKTAEEVKDMLKEVVTDGTGEAAQVPGYSVAGKTGTAQKPKEDGRGYEAGKYAASFIGFAPLQDPEVAILVIIDEPTNGMYGGTVAAPVFQEIMQFSLRHLRIAPRN